VITLGFADSENSGPPRAGHIWKEIAGLSGVSERSLRRIAVEDAITTTDYAVEPRGRPAGAIHGFSRKDRKPVTRGELLRSSRPGTNPITTPVASGFSRKKPNPTLSATVNP
jgi:hypothetical protein